MYMYMYVYVKLTRVTSGDLFRLEFIFGTYSCLHDLPPARIAKLPDIVLLPNPRDYDIVQSAGVVPRVVVSNFLDLVGSETKVNGYLVVSGLEFFQCLINFNGVFFIICEKRMGKKNLKYYLYNLPTPVPQQTLYYAIKLTDVLTMSED